MATSTTYTTAQVHRRLGVPKPTLRNWTEHYAGFLSEPARAADGRVRHFCAEDLRVLFSIRYLTRVEGLATADQVRARLAAGFRVDLPADPVPSLDPSDQPAQARIDSLTTERDLALAALARAERRLMEARQSMTQLRGALTGAGAAILGLLLLLISAWVGG